MFKLDDMVRFIFFVLDKDKHGNIPRFRLLRFVESIHGRKVVTFERAILPNGKDGDSAVQLPLTEMRKSSVDYIALKKLIAVYPTMVEPMLLFQTKLQRRIMGEAWWRRKEVQIVKHLRTLGQSREAELRKEEKRLFKEREEMIKSDMGIIAYYFRRSLRNKKEREYPMPIVSLNGVEWTRTNNKGQRMEQE
jgi:hypothetical protein